MKKIFLILVSCIFCTLFATLEVSASDVIDNFKYIPKVITTADGDKMMFDSELARIARMMSEDAYGIDKGTNAQEIANTFREEGFTDIQQRHTSDENELFSNNFLVGVKTFEVNGKEKHIMAIAFRGTDWTEGNDLITDASFAEIDGFHTGFYAAAANARQSLGDMEFPSLKNEDGSNMTFYDYLYNCMEENDNYFILVTGHSLGGAAANIFAGELIPQVSKDNVMCYTFASPIVCISEKAKNYDAYNIFNIINTKDIVPKIGVEIFLGYV